MISFNEFLELDEELNYKITNDVIEFEDRWFYYDSDDEIVYGCDDEPTGNNLFCFNPVSCKVIYKDETFEYDINNPICIISLKMDKTNEFTVYADGADEYLKSKFGYSNITNIKNDRVMLQNKLDDEDGYRILIMYGKELIASTFDIIEEN